MIPFTRGGAPHSAVPGDTGPGQGSTRSGPAVGYKRPQGHRARMDRAPPYLLTVYDPTEGRLLRVDRFSSERDLAVHELEERDHYMRHAHVEVEGHAGRSVEDVVAGFERRAAASLRQTSARRA